MKALVTALALFCALTGIARANDRLHDLLQTTRLFDVLAAEYVVMAEAMRAEDPEMLGEDWLAAMVSLYDPREMEALYRADLNTRLAARPEVEAAFLDFAQSELGRDVITREVETRAQLLDPDWQAPVPKREDYAALETTVTAVIEGFDLIEGNIAAAMNSHLEDARGFFDALDMAFDASEMIASLYAEEPEIRENTEAWLRDYLFAAYAGLSQGDLEALAELSRDPLHRAFTRAQIAAFDAAFEGRSYQAGLLRALALRSSAL